MSPAGCARTAAFLVLACVGMWAPQAEAQGQGQGQGQGHGHGGGNAKPPGAGGKPSTASVDAAAAVGPTGSAEFAVRNFGSWVDDAYVLPPGEAWVGIGAGYWRLPFANQVDAPSVSTSFGVASRLHLAATVPIATVRYPDGYSSSHLGDVYLSAKIGLRPAARGVGVALSPLVEVLSDGSWPTADGGTVGRVHWAVPVNLEYRGAGWRTYGSVGYFSRGAVFASGTIDKSIGARAGVLGVLSHSYSTSDPLVPTGVDVNRARTDLSGGAYFLPRPSLSLYALAGRTTSRIDDYASKFFASGGVSIRVAKPSAARP